MNTITGIVLIYAAAVTGFVAVPDSAKTSKAPQAEIERARQFVVSRLGEEIGATCVVETRSAIITESSRDGYMGIDSWKLRARFRPDLSRNLECSFDMHTLSKSYDRVTVHRGRRVFHTGEVPDCRDHPELCTITIDRAAAVDIGISKGLYPGDNEYFIELELSDGEPGIVWRISSRPEGAKFGWVLVVDAANGEIRDDRENNYCWD